MVVLRNSRVLRGGRTAHWLTTEHKSVTVDVFGDEVRVRTDLASKGGGTTVVHIRIPVNDLPDLLQLIAAEVPNATSMLLDAAKSADTELTRRREHAASAAAQLKDGLAVVDDYVRKRYYALPAGEDEVEEQLTEVLDTIAERLDDVASALG